MSLRSRIIGDGNRVVTALLGPTNTGKTHRAIERMLLHPTGMMGFPLRLLAREVYERVVRARGPDQVALVTGEEKRIPPTARYFICTVESMPVSRAVSFLAVDEIQLAAHRQRGHVFTDRLLHARGFNETIFMGSDAMAPLLLELIDDVVIERADRLSTLRYAGRHKLIATPTRSAVVAFGVEQVYALAERLKAAHGGTAVVMGALSPRARNAQVELYQSGKVKHLVATDAIGMGLNLDIANVSFAGVRKFDGHRFRELSAAELAQIAGRAGRWKMDGTFSALNSSPELDPRVIEQIEQHRFAPVRKLFWRNSDLHFDSPERLLGDLRRKPPHEAFIPVRDEEDEQTLEALAAGALRPLLEGPEAIELLWEVCRVPDFRKTLTDSHVRFLEQVATALLTQGQLDQDWVAERMGRLDRPDGDIDALMTRIAYVRTWTYLAHQRGWLPDAKHWQGRASAIEDRLSDALHEALTQRFVDRTAMVLTLGGLRQAVDVEGDDVRVGGALVARLEGFRLTADPSLTGANLKAVLRALRPEASARLLELAAPGAELEVDSALRVRSGGHPVALLRPGQVRERPRVSVLSGDLLDGEGREQARRIIERWLAERVARLEALTEPHDDSPRVKGLLHVLRQHLGAVAESQVSDLVQALEPRDRRVLAKHGIRLGTRVVYVHPGLKLWALQVRRWLVAVSHGEVWMSRDVGPSGVDADGGEPELWLQLGYVVLGPRAVRVDIYEKLLALLRKLRKQPSFPLPEPLLSWTGSSREQAVEVLAALGYKVDADGSVSAARQKKRRRGGRRRR